jgi:peptide/nickel transport system permease protein
MKEQMVNDQPAADVSEVAENRIFVASQWQLMWWRFRKHRVAVLSGWILLFFYLVALVPEFFAIANPHTSNSRYSLIPPQRVIWFDDGRLRPHVHEMRGYRDLATFKMVWEEVPDSRVYLRFFTRGFEYKLLGIFPINYHLMGIDPELADSQRVFLLGTDEQGRDMWSRLMYATRISMSIGLVGVLLSLVLGIFLGGISGYYGGMLDNLIQRGIEIVRSIPTIPLWMGLAAAVPQSWSVTQTYFAITIIISLFGWTDLARVIRGKFLSMREEEFVAAAIVSGASEARIIFRHMLPSFVSHIIAAISLAIPAMIISETALSFLGLGLRPPAISWGVLLQLAQNIQSIALTPWLLIPAIPVTISILAFNFLGDGLRDAADPYQ